MGYAFTTQVTRYKSYTSKSFDIRMSANGIDPQYVVVKVMNTKRPTAEVSVGVGYFSESRGYGGTSNKFVRLTDPNLVAVCRGVLVDDSGIAALIDLLIERGESLEYAGETVVRLLKRWWVLAQQENPSAFVTEERRRKAFDDKRFSVGDRVRYRSSEAVVTGEGFDWSDWSGGGWRFSFFADGVNYNVRQHELRKVEGSVVS